MGMNFNIQSQRPDFETAIEAVKQKIAYNDINCVRVGIVQRYDKATRVAKVLIANKLVLGVNEDGTQKTDNYAPIYAKVLFLGWGDSGITVPIKEAETDKDGKGTEGILLFCDREIESWFINGNVNDLKYQWCHNKSDAIFIAGVHSMPNMVASDNSCINIYNGSKSIKVKSSGTVVSGSLQADTLIDTNGASGSIVDSQGKTLADVKNGIITQIY